MQFARFGGRWRRRRFGRGGCHRCVNPARGFNLLGPALRFLGDRGGGRLSLRLSLRLGLRLSLLRYQRRGGQSDSGRKSAPKCVVFHIVHPLTSPSLFGPLQRVLGCGLLCDKPWLNARQQPLGIPDMRALQRFPAGLVEIADP